MYYKKKIQIHHITTMLHSLNQTINHLNMILALSLSNNTIFKRILTLTIIMPIIMRTNIM